MNSKWHWCISIHIYSSESLCANVLDSFAWSFSFFHLKEVIFCLPLRQKAYLFLFLLLSTDFFSAPRDQHCSFVTRWGSLFSLDQERRFAIFFFLLLLFLVQATDVIRYVEEREKKIDWRCWSEWKWDEGEYKWKVKRRRREWIEEKILL